jgi:hypothetical protein
MYIGHVADMSNRMQQNDALKKSQRKATKQKKSLFFGYSSVLVTSSETGLQEEKKP